MNSSKESSIHIQSIFQQFTPGRRAQALSCSSSSLACPFRQVGPLSFPVRARTRELMAPINCSHQLWPQQLRYITFLNDSSALTLLSSTSHRPTPPSTSDLTTEDIGRRSASVSPAMAAEEEQNLLLPDWKDLSPDFNLRPWSPWLCTAATPTAIHALFKCSFAREKAADVHNLPKNVEPLWKSSLSGLDLTDELHYNVLNPDHEWA